MDQDFIRGTKFIENCLPLLKSLESEATYETY